MACEHGTHTEFATVPVQLPLVVHREDCSSWTHGAVVEHCKKEHNNRS